LIVAIPIVTARAALVAFGISIERMAIVAIFAATRTGVVTIVATAAPASLPARKNVRETARIADVSIFAASAPLVTAAPTTVAITTAIVPATTAATSLIARAVAGSGATAVIPTAFIFRTS
jgi:hypothetical protein